MTETQSMTTSAPMPAQVRTAATVLSKMVNNVTMEMLKKQMPVLPRAYEPVVATDRLIPTLKSAMTAMKTVPMSAHLNALLRAVVTDLSGLMSKPAMMVISSIPTRAPTRAL